MPRDLFGEVTRPSISIGNRKWYTLPLSLFSHSAIVLMLIALPILAPAVMPSVFADDDLEYVTKLLPPPPPPPIRPKPIEINDRPPAGRLMAPIDAPAGIAPEPVRQDPPVSDGLAIIGGSIEDASTALVPPPAPPPTPQAPVRVGGAIRTPVKVGGADPVYPAMAQAARVQGIVIIEATIGADGRIMNARILRSVPLLDQAALDAVRSWQYTPTLLNGNPVPVIMTVTVSFTLSR